MIRWFKQKNRFDGLFRIDEEKKMKFDGVILDIDGTLWNSTQVVADAWNAVLAERGDIPFQLTAERLMQLFGRPVPIIADILFPFLEKEERYELIHNCCKREHEYLRTYEKSILYPGVAETIRALAERVPLFIVSNCESGYIELFAEKTGLGDCIKDSECPGRTGLGKGANIRLVAERNHLHHALYVGDIDGDRQASEEAGVQFCYASYGFGEVERADYVIHQFFDLMDLVEANDEKTE